MDEPIVVDIPGVGPVEFPATMSQDEINAAAKKLHDEANPQQPNSALDQPSNALNVVAGAGAVAVPSALKYGVHKVGDVAKGVFGINPSAPSSTAPPPVDVQKQFVSPEAIKQRIMDSGKPARPEGPGDVVNWAMGKRPESGQYGRGYLGGQSQAEEAALHAQADALEKSNPGMKISPGTHNLLIPETEYNRIVSENAAKQTANQSDVLTRAKEAEELRKKRLTMTEPTTGAKVVQGATNAAKHPVAGRFALGYNASDLLQAQNPVEAGISSVGIAAPLLAPKIAKMLPPKYRARAEAIGAGLQYLAPAINYGERKLTAPVEQKAAGGKIAKKLFTPVASKILKASEALGAHEGKNLGLTQTDNFGVHGGRMGGNRFPDFQNTSPIHQQDRVVWMNDSEKHAQDMINKGGDNTIWSTYIGAADQLKSNKSVFNDIMQQHYGRDLTPEQIDLINKRIATVTDSKKRLVFPQSFDIRDKFAAAELGGDTFARRGAMADILGAGEGVGKTRGGIALPEYQDILRSHRDPLTEGVPTSSVGTRLFSVDPNTPTQYSQKYHPDYNWTVHGQDTGVQFEKPIPQHLAVPDWYNEINARAPGKTHGNAWFSYMKDPQRITEEYLTRLQKEGYAAGGKIEEHSVKSDLPDVSLSARSIPSMSGMPGVGYMQTPQGAMARLQMEKELGEAGRLRAGASAMGMALPGQQGAKFMPGQMDLGYNTQAGPGNLDVSAFRSINPIPGKGHMQGVRANYSIPFAKGGKVGILEAAAAAFKKQFTPGFYHGSPSPNIKAFDPSKGSIPDVKDHITPNVTFVTPKPEFAESFLPEGFDSTYRTGSTMYPVNVNLGKHFDPNTPEGSEVVRQYLLNKYKKEADTYGFDEAMNQKHEHYMDKLTHPVNNWKLLENPEILDYLKNTGHNSFSVTEGGIKNVGIFDPKHIRGKFAKYNPEDAESPDFMKAEGGSVQHFQAGGVAKLLKHAHGQHPKVAQALEEYLKGNISQEERIRIMNQFLPMRQWKELPPNYSDDEIKNALMSNKQAKALAPVPAGMRVGNRLDIPAYTQNGVYVDTTHDLAAGNAPISYNRTGHLKDVEFSSKPNQAVRVGLGTKEQALTPMGAEIGSGKSPFALIKGTNVGTSDDEVRRMMEEMLKDPRYTQIGMDPRKHSQFYDKETGLPVWAAEEKLQSGPLILAPKQGLETTSWDDPRLNLSDFEGKKYAAGGNVVKKALNFAKSVPFVHYSTSPNIARLEPGMYGTGIKGAEAARLKDAPDIKPRSYFYVNQGEKTMRPEAGLGSHKYSGTAEDIYPLHEDPEGFSQIAKTKALDPYMMQFGREVIDQPKHLNELERLIKGAGYKGYADDNVGLLFHPTEVQKITD